MSSPTKPSPRGTMMEMKTGKRLRGEGSAGPAIAGKPAGGPPDQEKAPQHPRAAAKNKPGRPPGRLNKPAGLALPLTPGCEGAIVVARRPGWHGGTSWAEVTRDGGNLGYSYLPSLTRPAVYAKAHRAHVIFTPNSEQVVTACLLVQQARRQSSLWCHIQTTPKRHCVLSHGSRQVPPCLQACAASLAGRRFLLFSLAEWVAGISSGIPCSSADTQ